MYFLLEACQHPAVLRLIYFGMLMLDIITIIIPIGLIVLLLIDFAKAVIAGNEETAKKSTKLVVKRIIYAIIVFIVPWMISVLMNILSNLEIDTGTNYTICLTNAKSGNFAYYDSLLEAEEKIKEEKRRLEAEKRKQNQKEKENSKLNNAMADKLINIAKTELGNTDETKYGIPDGTPWCAFFVHWAMKKTDQNGKNLFNDIIQKDLQVTNTGSAGWTIYNYHNSNNLAFHYSKYYANKYNKNASYKPKKGDTIYFNWKSNWNGLIGTGWEMHNRTSHIGLVEYSDGNKVYTIEGNAGSPAMVRERSFSLDDSKIMGYGSWYNN